MGDLIKVIYDNWPDGANTSMEADVLPPTAFAISRNTCLKGVSDGKAIVGKRKGGVVFNSTPITSSAPIIGQHQFNRISSGTFTPYHLVITGDGRFRVFDTAGTSTYSFNGAFTSSAVLAYLPSFADANNLSFMANGVDTRKFNGTVIQQFGIIAPTTAPTLAGGAAGNHNGTYEARVTYYDSTTGHESSAGLTSATVTVANKQISWTNIPVAPFLGPGDGVDSRKLYIRNTATQANFYFVATIADNTTTTYTSNLLDSSLTVLGPDTFSHNPPLSTINYLAWHKSRMFAATPTTLYFSPISDPESFDPSDTEPVNPDDSQKITGIFAAFDVLIIFKSSSMYALIGDDPSTWKVRLIDPTIGCVAHRSIVYAGNELYWWSQQGPVSWDGTGVPQLLGPNKISRSLSPDLLSFATTEIAKICGVDDKNEHRVIWAVPELSKTRNTIMFPYSYRVGQWESTGWDPWDVASLALVEDSVGRPYVMVGGYSGQIFKFWYGDHDAIDPTVTYQGTFVAAATSYSTITDGAAAFPTSGGKYIERKVTVVNSLGIPVDDVRPYITNNTATVLTLSAPIDGFVVGQTYTYYVGGPALYFTTAWLDQGDPFLKKRYQHCFISIRPTNTLITALVDLQMDFQVVTTGVSPTYITLASGGLWDVGAWDAITWDAFESHAERFRIGRTGRATQVRIQHYAPNAGLDILKIGLTAEKLTEQIG